ncbi:MAG TPA: tyrosine-type recombinase/integrase [Spirochaetota bacterium]|nr:tyrosine-type recombinase/integrase [Smithellaceae bacterium]HPL18454.1 tyrosine-type recombinase/integrase [Spirochaetota bacterium]
MNAPRRQIHAPQRPLLSDYHRWLTLKGYKPRGIEEELRTARRFLAYAEEHGIALEAVNVKAAESFREELRRSQDEKGTPRYAPATINVRIAHLRKFFRFLVETGTAAQNPFNGIERMREPVRLPRNILTVEETRKLLEGITLNDASDVKFKVIVELLYATGARAGEIERLTRGDIDLAGGYILIRDDKERQDRRCPLTETARELLSLYLTHNVVPPAGKVFAHGETRTLNTWLNNRLKRLTEKRELPRITCHGLRHTVATHLIKEGADIREVQEYLGHRRIKNTEVYTRLFPDDLKEAIERSHPRERRYAEERHGNDLDDREEPL